METNCGDRMSLIANRPLTTRLCVVFLVTIGLVLIAFSAAFYGFASFFLHRQVGDQVASSVRSLSALVETSPEGVEWEPQGRTFDVGVSPLAGEPVWIVLDQDDFVVDQSDNLDVSEVATAIRATRAVLNEESTILRWQDRHWLFGEQWIRVLSGQESTESPADADEVFHRAICLRLALSLSPIHAMLRTTAITLAVLSALVWIGSFFAARFVCSRALQPLREMTSAARKMNADLLTVRLPRIRTHDEIGELTTAFNALLDRLEDSFERQQRFTGDASHQLRTPLTAILGQLDVALRRDRSGDEYKQTLRVVHDRASHLAKIVEALLFLARADAESDLPDRQPIDARSFLTTWMTTFAEHERFADLQFDAGRDSAVMILGHETLLSELLTILVDNAFKFSEPGTSVIVQLSADSESAIVQICDYGHGIADSDLQSLGTPFFRADSARQKGIPGVGLGLSIAIRIALILGGTLQFSSEEKTRTTASVRLPLLSADWRVIQGPGSPDGVAL